LNGAQYVGCVSGSTIGTQCYQSCSDCCNQTIFICNGQAHCGPC
jgi:hypothetical protein